jgi:GNAT superfamily N-acetyltransferase
MIRHADIYSLSDYGNHLKGLTPEDKMSRFGHAMNDYGIDQLILQMLYHSKDHELWAYTEDETIVGWGHMAKSGDSWELAVSVDKEHQRKGIGNKLIVDMMTWAKFHHVPEVFMHCIEDNKVIQHLALKNELKTRERGYGERTAAIQVPEPTLLETNTQLFKEQAEILSQITELRLQLANLWLNPTHTL